MIEILFGGKWGRPGGGAPNPDGGKRRKIAESGMGGEVAGFGSMKRGGDTSSEFEATSLPMDNNSRRYDTQTSPRSNHTGISNHRNYYDPIQPLRL